MPFISFKTPSLSEVLDVTVERAKSGMAMLVVVNEMGITSKVTRVILIQVGDRRSRATQG